jgi:hypothetical protein
VNDTILGAVIVAGATLLVVAIYQSLDWLRRRARRRTFARSLAEEVSVSRDLLKKFLVDFPSDGDARTWDAFLLGLSTQKGTDHLFVSLLPNLDVVAPDLIGQLSNAHTRLRVLAGWAQTVLERGGSFNVPMGQTRPIRDTAQRLTSDLEEVRARLMEVSQASSGLPLGPLRPACQWLRRRFIVATGRP